MLRYSVMRVLVFFGVLCVLWLVGLRAENQRVLLLALSLVVSMVVSFFLLKPLRLEMSRSIAERVDARAVRAQQRHRDEIDEDSEDT